MTLLCLLILTLSFSPLLSCTSNRIAKKNLPPEDFIRIHRPYIININKVDVLTSSYLEIGAHNFTIGRNYKEEVLRRLEGE